MRIASAKWGIIELVRGYGECLPEAAIAALAYYDAQTPEEREKAVDIAMSAVLRMQIEQRAKCNTCGR